jgi:hypothetical protein
VDDVMSRFAAAAVLAVLAVPGLATAEVLDPVFSNSFESGLIGFGPPLTFVAAPSSDTPTVDVPLQVTLSAAALMPTFVAITSSDPAHLTVSGGGTTVGAGQTSAVVQVNGIAGRAAPVTLRATLGNTIGASVRVEEALNETDLLAEADFCNVQFPQAFTVAGGALTPSIFGQLFETGATESAGPPAGWSAQVGYGPSGSDPRQLGGWQFFDASYNVQVDNNDEFQASFKAPSASGVYSYTYRFSNDGGATFTYCDVDGAGWNPGLTFSSAQLGQMTVGHLVINEIDYDQAGTDMAEFIELFNSTDSAIDLSSLAIVLVNGSTSLEYARYALSAAGAFVAPGQYLVLKSSSVVVPGGVATIDLGLGADHIQNGAPDGVVLIDTAAQRVLDALSYEGSITAASISGFPGTPNLVEGTAFGGADSNTVAGSLSRVPNGTDTDNAATDWSFTTTPTPGAANTLTP